jgi:acyl CoA:acetate/3-ketoacid CoA transferase beta subunit
MSLTATELAARLKRDIKAGCSVWVAPVLMSQSKAMAELHSGANGTPDMALVAANRVAVNGDVSCDAAPPPGANVVAVLLLDGEPRGAIVPSCGATTNATRILCDHGMIDVTAQGLVIVELAPGVSAKELQKKVQPTLLISPDVTEMIVSTKRMANS